MFDIAWSELMVIAVIALVVIGPKDLPKAIFTLGKWVRKARVVAREFQTHIDDMMRETELDELRKEALKTRDLNIKKMMEDTIDPKGEVGKAFDVGLNGHPGSTPEPDLPQAPEPVISAPATPMVTDSVAPSAAPSPITTAPITPEPPQPAPVSQPAPVPRPDAVAAAQPTDKQT
ncbi:sec-independent protein translocase protein TatB [Azospirillum lipoferum]|uniref:Sec-independent protein translocase protein TatB n=1 Tax=Azospirillum lipoferum TaxID=193 RepID=A0A5A9GJQ3_AZOLI|nr:MULTISPECIES: Sec-independent protein translocase protein TatB [Azospirillum]KAA0594691.1 twin-arginine translocase subunit TatB [Azospirillum lipoferum]MCP1613001.1 sec-independent protein translocase protein TatB [Azospirillum lipoferum]MDW5532808.1 Sec-independent protein translocase protein TatB [Azospirillum sp. NL1]